MFDQESLKPVIVSMVVYLILVQLIPQIIKKPTGISFVDDLVLFLHSQKGAFSSGALFTGLIVLITDKIVLELS